MKPCPTFITSTNKEKGLIWTCATLLFFLIEDQKKIDQGRLARTEVFSVPKLKIFCPPSEKPAVFMPSKICWQISQTKHMSVSSAQWVTTKCDQGLINPFFLELNSHRGFNRVLLLGSLVAYYHSSSIIKVTGKMLSTAGATTHHASGPSHLPLEPIRAATATHRLSLEHCNHCLEWHWQSGRTLLILFPPASYTTVCFNSSKLPHLRCIKKEAFIVISL